MNNKSASVAAATTTQQAGRPYGYVCHICGDPVDDSQPTEHSERGLVHTACCVPEPESTVATQPTAGAKPKTGGAAATTQQAGDLAKKVHSLANLLACTATEPAFTQQKYSKRVERFCELIALRLPGLQFADHSSTSGGESAAKPEPLAGQSENALHDALVKLDNMAWKSINDPTSTKAVWASSVYEITQAALASSASVLAAQKQEEEN